MAENRVIGGAGAAGIPIGGRVGSKGQAEVKVLQRAKLVSLQPLGRMLRVYVTRPREQWKEGTGQEWAVPLQRQPAGPCPVLPPVA